MSNEEIFKQVIQANIDTLINRINSKAFDLTVTEAFYIKNLSETEVRQLAVVFFQKNLLQRSSELTENNFNNILKS